MVVVAHVPDVGDVLHVAHLVAEVLQRPMQEVAEQVRPQVADVGVLVDRAAAGVDADPTGLERLERLGAAGQRVVQADLGKGVRHGARNCSGGGSHIRIYTAPAPGWAPMTSVLDRCRSVTAVRRPLRSASARSLASARSAACRSRRAPSRRTTGRGWCAPTATSPGATRGWWWVPCRSGRAGLPRSSRHRAGLRPMGHIPAASSSWASRPRRAPGARPRRRPSCGSRSAG